MKRTIYLVPIAAVLAAAGVTSVANAALAPSHHRGVTAVQPASATAPHAPGHQAARRHSAAPVQRSSAADDRGITAAIKHTPLLGDVPASDVAVRSIRVAAAGSPWASAVAHPIDQRTDDAHVALHLSNGHWSVVTLGTAGVGCVVPAAVRADLGLSCEPGQ